jgi:hypothetical protein
MWSKLGKLFLKLGSWCIANPEKILTIVEDIQKAKK